MNISQWNVSRVEESNGHSNKFDLHCMTLKIKVKHYFAWPFLSPVILYKLHYTITLYKFDFGVDSDIFEIKNI